LVLLRALGWRRLILKQAYVAYDIKWAFNLINFGIEIRENFILDVFEALRLISSSIQILLIILATPVAFTITDDSLLISLRVLVTLSI